MSFDLVHFVPASGKEALLALPVHLFAQLDMSRIQIPITGVCTSARAPAYVVISRLPSATSRSAIKVFDLTVRQHLTVADVYNILLQNGRHKYEFDRDGVGCRWWMSEQLDLLKENQVVTNPQEVAAAKAGIQKLWPEGTPLELDQGAYYQ